MTGEVQAETKRLIAECCERHGIALLAMETDEDHVHVFVSAPPRFSAASIAGLLKGYSSKYLRARFPHLKKKCGKEHLWSQAYDVGTAGNVCGRGHPPRHRGVPGKVGIQGFKGGARHPDPLKGVGSARADL
ncbi:IS200/IS605 family transposase [Pyrinomonas sp.]|uniref:IS200/IS605 family transposase n=1 Tax=Pyrinomonas sp. TaxID=2080306 RepID=UPI00331A158E